MSLSFAPCPLHPRGKNTSVIPRSCIGDAANRKKIWRDGSQTPAVRSQPSHQGNITVHLDILNSSWISECNTHCISQITHLIATVILLLSKLVIRVKEQILPVDWKNKLGIYAQPNNSVTLFPSFASYDRDVRRKACTDSCKVSIPYSQILTKTGIYRQMSVNFPVISVHENPSGDSRAAACTQTDRQTRRS